MKLKILSLFFLIFVALLPSCQTPKSDAKVVKQDIEEPPTVPSPSAEVQPGAWQTETYLPKWQGKRLAFVVNQTSTIGATHLVDTLLSQGVEIVKIFAPEHGFRGMADAGEQVADGKDKRTGVPVFSLYGKKKKPSAEDLANVDAVVFDIQDVGARFYTYISSMHYIMEACAENGKEFWVLDRPNPNGHYVDGPVLEKAFSSFVGMHPIPVVHGMTIGEYAQMINGEKWLKDGLQCPLQVIKCKDYTHRSTYSVPIKPSPNLPNDRSIYLYPSICFFEGTTASAGRGTLKQFQIYGHPDYPGGDFSFTPESRLGAKYPKHENKLCRGYDLSTLSPATIRSEARLNLSYLLNYYKTFPTNKPFFLKNNFIHKLAGNDVLKQQIEKGLSEAEIRASWEPQLSTYKTMRKQYLLYEDF